MNLVILESSDVDAAGVARLTGARAMHLITVLRVVTGQTVRVGLLDGPAGTGTVERVLPDSVHLRCVFESAPPPLPRVDLLLALPRPKVMRRLWAQLAALGVGQIILTKAERVERNYFDTNVITPECYRPLLIEGLQQARDTRMPRVSIHRQFKILVEDHLDALFPGDSRLMADPGATVPASDAARDAGGARLLLAVGPEGGWNDFERDLLQAHGFRLVGLGPRTLRTDTAVVSLVAIVHDASRG